ncbi:MAG: helix-turn-helix transcriptional regulator [Bacilli bacterium]
MKLSETLRSLRSLHQLTQQDLASYLKISRATYANYEQNRRDPDYYLLIKLANFYHISLDYLLDHNQEQMNVIEKELDFKSSIHRDLYNTLNQFEESDIKLVKQYVYLLCEKQQSKK